ncbi:uncharacterized protein CLAFUR5_13235 [Fulvia fulva]|uniref:2EXR domain-containing protein n=1 Tax=Passalora fulva TaxID=5499 RepID=A0A9Q8PK29_PASFU|nr:uncharacterized protein CLAFUR5_13235 [Fulvia fulva]KAK4613200.1 hypothetical protein CLAFUR0_13392 [Fulvia fulva]UJO23940.1 hypothetical protein CLAFUR5_13235 [Fulvia fulva]
MPRDVFPFLDLSAELRNEIYILSLQQPTPMHLEYLRGIRTSEKDNTSPRQSPPAKRELTCSLLRTCRQINHEATSILYGYNTFAPSLGDCSYLRLFLKQLGSCIKLIRHVELPSCYNARLPSVRQVFHLLKQAAMLESVTFSAE